MKLKAGILSYYLQTKNANKYLPSIYLLDSSNFVIKIQSFYGMEMIV